MVTIDDENFHKVISEIRRVPVSIVFQAALAAVNRWLIEHEHGLLKLTDNQLRVLKEIETAYGRFLP